MRASTWLAASAAFLAAMHCGTALAGPGDVFVPAHRTRDGSYVPANVPTTSGGTHAAQRPRRLAAGPSPSLQRLGSIPPLFAEARPVLK